MGGHRARARATMQGTRRTAHLRVASPVDERGKGAAAAPARGDGVCSAPVRGGLPPRVQVGKHAASTPDTHGVSQPTRGAEHARRVPRPALEGSRAADEKKVAGGTARIRGEALAAARAVLEG